ncbi:hypothetical protein [Sphingomonas sp. GC_Shp_4]|uniref:hypothetical protein n=2 Tax=Sphingomonas TaxID=13687 RepID=UPI00226BB747|nr:hypothetical protein [Sphingomonas sp. GC_Shp_4]
MSDMRSRDIATLYRQLTAALALADELQLTIVAIHIDEARSQMIGLDMEGPEVSSDTTA